MDFVIVRLQSWAAAFLWGKGRGCEGERCEKRGEVWYNSIGVVLGVYCRRGMAVRPGNIKDRKRVCRLF